MKIKNSTAKEYHGSDYIKKLKEEAEDLLLKNYNEFFLVTDSRLPYHNITVLAIEPIMSQGKYWTDLPSIMRPFSKPDKNLLSKFKYNNPRYLLGNDIYRYLIDDLDNDKTFTLLETDRIINRKLFTKFK